jgi:hypothetical protein
MATKTSGDKVGGLGAPLRDFAHSRPIKQPCEIRKAGAAIRQSGRSQAVADSPIGALGGPQYHNAKPSE